LIVVESQPSGAFSSFNIGPDESDSATSGELATMFCESWGEGTWEQVSADNPHESGLLRLDCSKIHETFGWRPRWGIEKSVAETAMWYRQWYGKGDVSEIIERQVGEFIDG
jgi:CDP-glucose 4,6-dehydratase